MNSLKIAHLAVDEKFIDHAIKAFESEAPGSNDLYVLSKAPLKLVKSKAEIVSRFQAISGALATKLSEYDLIIIHSLNPAWFRTIKNIPIGKTLVWLGWGYDYYDIIKKSKEDLLLPLTQSALKHTKKRSTARKAKEKIIKLIRPTKESIIERIEIFAPVLPIEYELVQNGSVAQKFPQQAIWNYGNLEDDMVKGFLNEKSEGDSILVGNSASAENNHIDAFSLLSKMRVTERKIYSPLSYGDPEYRQLILNEGEKHFEKKFVPLIDFMLISEYVKTLKACGFVVMNHLRQQAVGNIVIMLYLGAKVFLRAECPTFAFLKMQGAVIFTVQELEKTPSLIDQRLDQESMAINKRIVEANWSRDASKKKTRNLLMQACNIKNGN